LTLFAVCLAQAAGTYWGDFAEVIPFSGRITPKQETKLFPDNYPYSCWSLNHLCASLPVYVSSGHSNVQEVSVIKPYASETNKLSSCITWFSSKLLLPLSNRVLFKRMIWEQKQLNLH
jgi:hypothetical protein